MVVDEKNAKLFTLLKEYQKPYKPPPNDKVSDAITEVTLTATSANSIRTWLLEDADTSQAAESTETIILPPVVSNRDEWRASP